MPTDRARVHVLEEEDVLSFKEKGKVVLLGIVMPESAKLLIVMM